ncbi:hypothetical protein B0T14DRAFT_520816 [Immersiella caudata]|uniref:Uncharacterized protein n=1 Tax=Immersiella caudata TaxID=314043 RepID=A0AA40C0D0_9PEZI|nr:hypothetical protein B0T14DRAFT_520816 [Immersiella caudata]
MGKKGKVHTQMPHPEARLDTGPDSTPHPDPGSRPYSNAAPGCHSHPRAPALTIPSHTETLHPHPLLGPRQGHCV